MPDYIFDTTVLSKLAAVGHLHLLEKRYRQVALTTVDVSDELRRGVQAGYGYLEDVLEQIQSINPGGWLRVAVPECAEGHQLRGEFDLQLGPGEASCLALADITKTDPRHGRFGGTPIGPREACVPDGNDRHPARACARWHALRR